jgi:hypothetical protein
MEDELLFETPNGSVITESEAKSKYGDRFKGLLDSGAFKETGKTADKKEEVKIDFDVEAFYISPNGSEIKGTDVVKKYGNRSQSLVDDGTLKKKDPSVVSTGGEANMVGTTPIQETPDTLLESGGLLNNNTELNSIMVGEVPFSQLSAQEQQTFYEEIERLEKAEKLNKAAADNPYGIRVDEKFKPLEIEGLNIEKDPIVSAAQELYNKKNAPTDFSKLVEGVEDTEKIVSANRVDLLKKFQKSKNNTNLSFTEDGKIVGNRTIPKGVIGTTPKVKDENLNWFQKLIMSPEEYNEIEEAKTVNPELLSKMDIDVSDYQAWEAENTKEDGFVYQQVQDLINSDSDNDYLNDKRNFKKLSAYVNSMGDEIENDLSVIENKLLFETNQETRRQLLNTQSKLKAQQIKNISRQYNIISLFPALEASEDAKKNRREQYIIDQRNGDVSGGFGDAVLLPAADSAIRFIGGIFSAIPSWVEQGGNLAGFEMEGLRALNESLDSMLSNEVGTVDGALDTSTIERRTVEKLKPVTINWKGKPLQVGVTPEGDIVDINTMVSMGGILTNDEVKEVNELAKKVPNYEYEWSAGSITQGTVGTLVNLVGLIKGGKWATKTIQKGLKKVGLKTTVPGGIGMGSVSYMSTVAGEVNDIKSQLMEAGVPEEEAMSRAIMYGNGRASLDGIFSGLAGGNTKLLEATKSFPKILKDLALKPKTVVSSKVFQDKVKDLVKENGKELFIEELPVLFTGNILNGLANDSVGKQILNESTSNRDIVETAILTVLATTGVGSKRLLSNNKRKDLIRAASLSSNIEKDIANLVNSGQMSVADAKSVYQEIYSMQTALNQTQGSVVMSGNQEEAAALLNQRRKLMDQRSNLEGPLKEDIDKKIEDVDKQIEILKAEDTAQAIEASGGETTIDVNVTKDDALASLKAENEVRLKANLPAIIESEENILKEQDKLIKEKQDAIQESKTEEQVLSDDGGSKETGETDKVELQGVGKGDTRQTTVTDEKTLTPEQQVKSDELNKKRDEKIDQESRRFVVPGTKIQVQMNADGTANPVAVKENTDKPVNRSSQAKANKMILENVIDVNAGDKLDLEGDTSLTEEQYSEAVADRSNNIKEVAETLDAERKKRKSKTKEEKERLVDPLDIKGKIGKITEADYVKYGDRNNITSAMKRFWFKNKNKFGQNPVSDLDTRVQGLDGYTIENESQYIQDVIDFITANPTGKLDIELGLSQVEKDLEAKFEQLTGLKPTPVNIRTVNNIDPNREPISETQKKSKDLLQKEASEPGVFGKKKGPSPDKILGKKKTSSDKTKQEGENVNRKKFWRSWNKAYRESKKDQTTRRKQLSDAIQDLLESKIISTKKAKSLIKKISGVNLNNPRLVNQVLEYITKVNIDAVNAQKFDDAKNFNKKIKRLLKSDSLDAEVAIAAKQFNKIDPNLVEDLDLYLENAQKVVNGLTKTKTDKEGNLIFAGTIDIKGLDNYTSKVLKNEVDLIRKAEAQAFSDLTGLDSSEFTIDEMRSILEKSDSEKLTEANEQMANDKDDVITKGVKRAFEAYKGAINDIIKNRIDPISGEPLVISKADQKVIKDFMEVDIDLMTTAKEKLEALDAMVNFIVNQGTGGVVATTKRNEGMKNVIEANKKLKPARKLKLFGSEKVADFWYKKLGATPRIIENLFKGTSTARVFNKLSGFDGFRNGVAKAEKLSNDIAEAYVDKFIKPTSRKNAIKGTTKTQPNGTDFNTAANDTERGVFAFMRRTVDGTKEEQKNEFKRRKDLIEETITTLNDSGETKKSQLIKESFDKILSGSNSIQDIEDKVDPINKEAVEWMTSEWSKVRPELENVSLNVYNKVLGKDINYTPDSFSSLKDQVSSVDQEIGSPQFQGTSQKIYDKESGVLMDIVRPKKLPAGRVVNLGFDSSNISNLKDALTDLETAESIQIMKGFLGTSKNMNPAFKSLIPDVDNRNLIFSKFQNYVNSKRGASQKIQDKETIKLLNQIAGIGVSRVLGGPTQFLKQLTPLVNTATNLMFDLGSVGKGIQLITSNPDAQKWLANSGYEIANRGLQSITNLEGTNTKLDKSAEGRREKLGRAVIEANKFYLEKFLVNPDRFAAQASWIAYYMNDLKKQGIDPSNIDWSNHKVNKQAGAFAEQQVGRQQNVSDTDLQGDLFNSKNATSQVARKIFFPFANFLLNQKTRMYTDFNIALSKTATKDDKRNAYRSLAGLGVETAVFNLLGLAVTQGLAAVSQGLTGDDDEEDKEKAFENRKKGRAGNVVKDILSPIPPLDDLTLMMVNKVIKTASDGDDPFQFFAKDKKTFIEQAGVLGIPFGTAGELFEMIGMGSTGTYTDNYGKEREIDPSLKGAMNLNGLAFFLYSLGILPSEAGSIIKYNVKSYKKSGKKSKGGSGIPIKRKTKPKKKTKKRRSSGGPLLGGKKKSGGSLF